MPKTWIGWVVLFVVIVLVFHDPAGSAQTVRTWFDDAATFVQNL